MRRLPAPVLALAALSLFFGTLIALLVLANTVLHQPTPPPSQTRLNQYLIIGATVPLLLCFCLFVYDTAISYASNEPTSVFAPPLITGWSALLVILVFISIGAVDRLVHGLRTEWNVSNEPFLTTCLQVCFVVLAASYAWLAFTYIQTKRKNGRG